MTVQELCAKEGVNLSTLTEVIGTALDFSILLLIF